MPIVKSIYIPNVPVVLSKDQIIQDMSSYGQISRVDFGKYNDEVGDVFVHFYSFDEAKDGGYMAHQHDDNLPAHGYLCGHYVKFLPRGQELTESEAHICRLESENEELREVMCHNKRVRDEKWRKRLRRFAKHIRRKYKKGEPLDYDLKTWFL